MFFYESPVSWILTIVSMAIALFAQIRVQTAYGKYSKMHVLSNLTGVQVANMIVQNTGVTVVKHNGGKMSDHFDPRKK